ncbi:MAG: glycosyltransferase family 2 protein [Candidatus Omnitrophica bacterium]|nr:glycosyltransferase family 2 protein [Candidatus Omnitrophota bacterium]MBU4478254.1 glycosyltransferase family 2 protein [Candidatus Omnitrophota bacterium]MCG2703322.1 glycosyltransferase family 2 protein [Candidatus Omnitrophota bacterium]
MIFVLLPAYNEEKNITAVLVRINEVLSGLKKPFKVYVVNDGSTDATGDILGKWHGRLPLEVIDFKTNRGVGNVFKAGFKAVCSEAADEDILISLDCDRTHPADTFPAMIKAVEGGSDIVIASRYHEKSEAVKLPFLRLVFSDSINGLLRVCFPLKGARDYTTFFRAYRVGLVKKALSVFGGNFVEQAGFSCMAEILVKLRVFAPQVSEVPVSLRFDLRSGKSKMKIFRTIFEYPGFIAKQYRAVLSRVFQGEGI